MSKKIEVLPFGGLRAHKETQVRLKLNDEAVEQYTAFAKQWKEAGADPEFPPLIVFRDEKGVNHLADGFTRRVALKEAGFTEYPCEVKEGGALDAFLFGAKINQLHGSRLTNKDKQSILSIALSDKELVKLSNNALAKELGLSEAFVRRHRPASKNPDEKVSVRKTGKKGTVKTENIGKKTGKKAAKKATKPKSEKAAAKAEETTKQQVDKIRAAVGGKEGEKLAVAIRTNQIKLSDKDLKSFSGTSEDRIRQIAPLVTELGLPVASAIKAIDKVVDEKSKVEDLVIGCVAGSGVYRTLIEKTDYALVVFDPSKFTVEVSPK